MYNFDVREQTQNLVMWVRKWLTENGNSNTKVVVGVSGGKDSTAVVSILYEAIGPDRIIGVMMPNGEQKDISDSIRVCNHFKIKNYTINIGKTYETLTEELRSVCTNGNEFPTPMYSTNTPARLRMATLYGVGALVGNCRLVNTCNLSEDVVGWATYGGDGFNDFAPINHFTTEEVIAIGKELGAPIDLMEKTPDDGMCGFSDEEKLGFTYNELNKYIREGIKGEHSEKILAMFNKSKFKIKNVQLPFYDPQLPICEDFKL